MSEAKLRWQCRRGMRELDVLLTGFLEHHYPLLDEPHKAAFQQLLQLPDPDLMGYLLAGQIPADPELASVVDCIRGSASA